MIRGDAYAKITEFSVEIGAPVVDDDGNPRYAPSCPGIHVCGIGLGRNGQPRRYTVMDMPAPSDEEARRMWEAAKAAGELGDWSDEEYVCDLHVSEGLVAEFGTNRRMMPRLIAAVRALGEREIRRPRARVSR